MLLDLILCLAQRVDECCKDAGGGPDAGAVDRFPPSTARRRDAVASVTLRSLDTRSGIDGRTNAIRIRFSKPFAQDAHAPTTAGARRCGLPAAQRARLPEQLLQGIRYVPGALAIESPDTLRFDLLTGSPYSRGPQRGWQKGRYRLLVCGTQDAPSGRPALTDLSGVALDGEPVRPRTARSREDGRYRCRDDISILPYVY